MMNRDTQRTTLQKAMASPTTTEQHNKEDGQGGYTMKKPDWGVEDIPDCQTRGFFGGCHEFGEGANEPDCMTLVLSGKCPKGKKKMMNNPCEEYGGTCYPHGSDSHQRKERRAQGLCEWHAATCEGSLTVCPDCGYSYCEYHYPKHKRHS
ncbi:MAG: hypothetical protein M0Q91_08025 [Methanoregula sp.]|jgi:hypothetical protein|nr:hypothetical protein [Methanoregula sp.]